MNKIEIVEVEVYRVPPNPRLACVFERANPDRRGVLALPLRLRGRHRRRGARLLAERIEDGVYGVPLDGAPETLPPPPAPTPAESAPETHKRRGRRHAR